MCGGLNGCPTRTRSGWLHFDCITLGVIPEELEAMILHELKRADRLAELQPLLAQTGEAQLLESRQQLERT